MNDFHGNFRMYNIVCHTCTYSRIPENEPSGSKYVEDIKL